MGRRVANPTTRAVLKEQVEREYGLEHERIANRKDTDDLRRAMAVHPEYQRMCLLSEQEFRLQVQATAETDLWFFNRFIMGFKDLTVGLHREICDFLQDMQHRQKLLMIPVGCLKTSCSTHGQSIHFLIQPAETNIYFPNKPGPNTRILIGCESENQGKKNLSFIKEQLTQNRLIAWLWPHLVWNDPKKDRALWADTKINVRRPGIYREPTITAIGTDTALMGDHYDVHLLDDIATMAAWQSPNLMERAKNWRKAARSRVDDPRAAIQIGIATYWGEIYDDWQQDPSVQVFFRSLIEGNESIWPERFPIEVIDQLRKEDGDILFSMMRMNKPVRDGFTALNWEQLREFKFSKDGDYVQFREDDKLDGALIADKKRRGAPAMALAPPGTPLSKIYTNRTLRRTPVVDNGLAEHLLERHGTQWLRDKYGDEVASSVALQHRHLS